MSPPSGGEPPKPLQAHTPAEQPGPASVMGRLAGVTKLVFTISDQMARLAKEDERSQSQILELTRLIFAMNKEVATIAGQMQGIEKRLEDREKMMEAAIALRIREEVDRAMKTGDSTT